MLLQLPLATLCTLDEAFGICLAGAKVELYSILSYIND